MKKFFFILVTLLAFNFASAQTDKSTAPTTTTATENVTKQSEPQPLQKSTGRVTASDSKVPVVEKRKEGDGKGPIKTKPAPPATTPSTK